MASYGVKYELQFSDARDHKRTLEILKKDYTGDVLPIVGTETPVIIKYENQDNFYNSIIGSQCIINLKTTDTISYDEFSNFDEREYKIRILAGQEDTSITLDSPLWDVANTNWDDTDDVWALDTVFESYWEGFLIFDDYREQVISNPYDIQLRALDNLGTLDSYKVPYGNINTNADGSIITTSGNQNNLDNAFYYLKEILKLTGLDFNIFIQNRFRPKFNGVNINSGSSIFHGILINEFALTDDFVRKSAKKVLKEILSITNSRIYQANASWYIVSNHNYYDRSVIFGAGANQNDDVVTLPEIETLDVTNLTQTSVTLNGEIKDKKGLDIISRGFFFGENNLYGANELVFSSDTTDVFTFNKSGLITNRQYFVTAFASNSNFETAVGETKSFFANTTTSSTTAAPKVPRVQTLNPLLTEVFDTKMTLRARVTGIGDANVTEVGFYFGTDSFNFENNRKLVAATGQNISVVPHTFTLDTSTVTGPALTLTAGTLYHITAYAVNSSGTGIATNTVAQQTFNIFRVFNVNTLEPKNCIFDATKSSGDTITLSDTGSQCYTIMSGTTILSTSGLPTISGDCSTTTQAQTTEDLEPCVSIELFRHTTQNDLCCKDPTSRVHFINGNNFLSNTDVTKVYINDDCSTLLAGTQFLSSNLKQTRKWNGTALENVQQCPSCEDNVTPAAFLVENEQRGNRLLVQYLDTFVAGQRVVLTVETEFCFTILETVQNVESTPTAQINALCDSTTTVISEVCPTMTFFADYQGCGDDQIVTIGNNKNDLPDFVKQISTGICFFKIRPSARSTNNDDFNLGCTPTSKFELLNSNGSRFNSCDECNGVTTTQLPSTTTSTTAAPTIFFRIYRALQTNCSADDFLIEVSNQTNSFPAVITDGVTCFSNESAGGNGVNGDVDDFIGFDDCPTCQSFLATTTTPAPTTTQPPCQEVIVNTSTIAVNACCGSKPKAVYINALTLADASIVYINSTCTTILNPGNYVNDGSVTYFWNGFSLTEITCPDCP